MKAMTHTFAHQHQIIRYNLDLVLMSKSMHADHNCQARLESFLGSIAVGFWQHAAPGHQKGKGKATQAVRKRTRD
eukprot:1144113-Pelagomonas_calceolata.AAC.12